MKKIINISTRLFAVVFMFLTIFTLPVKATENGTITVINKAHSGELLANIDVRLYKIADYKDSSRTRIVMNEEFSEFDFQTDKLNSSADAEASAEECKAFIKEHNIEPIAQMVSNESGEAVFTNLSEGIYFVDQFQKEETAAVYKFSSTPFYVQMPYIDKDGNITYEVVTNPKNEVVYPQESYEVSVVKLWKDNNDRDKKRPESIEVGLFQDGELKDTVTLSDINNWSYIWKDLSKDVVWDVKELKVPDNYRMTVENNQNQFVITNQLVIHKETIEHGMIETIKGDKTTIMTVITGDTSMLGFYIALFALSGLLILVYVKRCKER